MRVGFGLGLEQTQKLIMTPELRQAITVLQLSTLELGEYIDQEMLENPLLEIKEEAQEQVESGETEVAGTDDPLDLDVDWKEYFANSSDLGYIRPEKEEIEQSSDRFSAVISSLPDHLTLQLHLTMTDSLEREIGTFLIGCLDDAGYLRTPIGEVAELFKVPEAVVIRVLEIIQNFDPPGVGARDLAECLLLQLRQTKGANPLAEQVILKHLHDLAAGKINRIAGTLGVTAREVQEVADLIKTFDPKPGRQYGGPGDVRYIIPDVIVERIGGEYVILVNDTGTPRLGINHTYRELLSGHDQEARRFIEGKLHAAVWLIRSIEQRRLTLYKVVNCIVDLQREFFDYGVRKLRPMNLKQVAGIINMHESTVSRATSNKYVQTPHGVFELKFFFASGVDNSAGEQTSSESIKRMIREMIGDENAHHPLSDQKLTEMLHQRGVMISRRTVAKYRDEMGVPATNLRKRY